MTSRTSPTAPSWQSHDGTVRPGPRGHSFKSAVDEAYTDDDDTKTGHCVEAKTGHCGEAKTGHCGEAKTGHCGEAKSGHCGEAKTGHCGIGIIQWQWNNSVALE